MKKVASQITVAIVCALLGFMLTYQFQLLSREEEKLAAGNNYNNAQITEEIEQLKKAKSDLEKQNNDLLAQIKKYEESVSNRSDASKELKSQLDYTRLLLGYTDVEGPGVIIKIEPKENLFSTDVAPQVINHSDLAYLVNELNFAGAEAISINDYRITNQTGMRITNGDSYILVNGERVSPSSTITIKAIGNKVLLSSTLEFKGTLSVGNLGLYSISFETSDDIKIPKYNKNYKSDYLKQSNE